MQSQPPSKCSYNNFNQWRTILERYQASPVTAERTSALEEDTNLFMNPYIRFLMTARQLGTLFTANIKLALQYVGRWCMNLKHYYTRHSIYAYFVQKNSTITGKYTLVYRTSETKYFSPQWSTYEIALIRHCLVHTTDFSASSNDYVWCVPIHVCNANLIRESYCLFDVTVARETQNELMS